MAVGQVDQAPALGECQPQQRGGLLVLVLMKGFELTHGGRRVSLPLSAQRLVALLALNERPLPRLYVAGTLWMDGTEEHSNGSLRSALWRLHRPGFKLVDIEGSHICLTHEVSVDVRRVQGVARHVMSSQRSLSAEDLHLLASGGELLPGWYDDWILIERERLRQLRLHALETMCLRFAQERHYSEAVLAGLAAVEEEPLRESAHRALITAHLAEGNSFEAIRQYRLYERRLQSELSLEPSSEMKAMVNGVLR